MKLSSKEAASFLKHGQQYYKMLEPGVPKSAICIKAKRRFDHEYALQPPICSGCGQRLPVDGVALGSEGSGACSCGLTYQTFSAPEWLLPNLRSGAQLFFSPPFQEGEPASQGAIARKWFVRFEKTNAKWDMDPEELRRSKTRKEEIRRKEREVKKQQEAETKALKRKMEERKKRNTSMGIGGGLLVVGLIITLFGRHEYTEGRESLSWPTTQGKITRSYVARVKKKEKNRTKILYRPRIFYSYSVNDFTYRGSKVTLSDSVSKEREASEWVGRYPTGGSVKVFYNPRKPRVAVLEPGVVESVYYLLVFGVLALVGGALVFGAAFTRHRFRLLVVAIPMVVVGAFISLIYLLGTSKPPIKSQADPPAARQR